MIPLRVLIVEDSEDDAFLILCELRNRDFKPTSARVEDAVAMESALARQPWDLVICDHRMPNFSSFEALKVVQKHGLDVPFIIVSGSIGEEVAVAAMKAGAHDYIMKDNLTRLVPAIQRELHDAAERRARREAERQLTETHARLQTALVQLVEGVAIAAADRRLTFFNEAASRLLGRPADPDLPPGDWARAYGACLLDGLPYPADRFPLLRALAGDCVPPEPILIRRPDGEPVVIAMSAQPLRGSDGALLGAIAVFRDITREHQIQEELVRQRKLADEASRRKTRILQALSHDVRAPLHNITLAAEALADDETLSLQGRDRLGEIKHGVHTVLDLLRDLVDLARLDAGQIQLDVTRFDAVDAVREVVASFRPEADAKGLRLDVACGAQHVTLETDRKRFQQILAQLLANAVKYTESGGVDVRCLWQESRPAFEVEDSGPGIAPDQRERIFEEFYRIDRPHRPMDEGKGLGLAVGYRLANRLGGELRYRDRAGGGSVFTLALPAETVIRAVETPADSTLKPLILVVDDEVRSRILLTRLLQKLGCATAEAGDAREALQSVRTRRPGLVLMDLMLPDMNGLEAIRIMHDDPDLCTIPVVVVTGDVSYETRRAAQELQVTAYLEKPINWPVLQRVIRDSLKIVPPPLSPHWAAGNV